jgi:DNA invertase Pin-like site-specific DNA recombinase
MPEANELTIHLMAALAQWERKAISTRTKAALQALKDRGVKLGSGRTFSPELRAKAVQVNKDKAAENENNKRAKAMAIHLSNAGHTLQSIADQLNASGFKTARNKTFAAEQVRRLLLVTC